MYDDFMSFMGFRNSLVESKIEECLAAARRGEREIEISVNDLTDSECEYIQKEVERRIRSGRY